MNARQRSHGDSRGQDLARAVGALGVVYGDIGTSPLYALRECFHGSHAVAPTPDNVFGVVSLLFWSLMIVVTIKYVGIILRADNRGEGGILALTALSIRGLRRGARQRWWLVAIGIFGAALFYGDGMITPAISVLSAVEGLEVAAPFLEPYVVPTTVTILIALFLVQYHGTARVGAWFGPVMLFWFATLAVLGIGGLFSAPAILGAVNPAYAVAFFAENHWHGFFVLGAVFLVMTGSEALYADMGHFGRRPIRLAWLTLVMPSLLLNYFGQGALLLNDPAAAESPFYLLAPSWALYPMVGLATLATVIASQAVISGVFSLTRQAIQLGYTPRVGVVHTSAQAIGQVYIPAANTALLVGVVMLVLGFQSSSNLASAYGVAVAATMVSTTALASVVAYRRWHWGAWVVGLVFLPLVLIDAAFLSANATKFLEGGWFPMLVGAVIFTLMTTWQRGREILSRRLREASISLPALIERLEEGSAGRVSGTAVFLTSSPEGVPHTLLHNLKHNKVLHERVILLTVLNEDVPRIPPEERTTAEALGNGFYRVTARFGFIEVPDVPAALAACQGACRVGLDVADTTFFLGRETLIPTPRPGMAIWREKLFVAMSRNASRAMDFFRIPTDRVIELGTQVEL